MDAIPEGISIIVLSRSDPPIQFARHYVNGRISLLGWGEIRFSIEETIEFLRMKSAGIGLKRSPTDKKLLMEFTDEALMTLHRKTRGWAAGLVLALECARIKGVDCQSLDNLALDEVFGYLANEVFARTDKDTREFLLKSAFLPAMTAKTAKKLTGVKAAGQILSNLEHNHYFIERQFVDEAVYLFHPLFREFLLARARDAFAEGEITDIQRNAAAILMESGNAEDAAEPLRDAKEWDGLARLILGHAHALVMQGRSKTLDDWITFIPNAVRERNPWLLFWKGVCVTPFNPPDGQRCLEKAFELFLSQYDRAGIFFSWSAVVDIFLYVRGSARFGPWVSRLDEILKKDGSFPSPEIEARVSLSMLNALSFGQPAHPDLSMWADKVFGILERRKDVDVNARLTSGVYLGVYSLWKGDLGRAAIVLDLLHKIAASDAVSEIVRITIKTYEALYDLFAYSPDSCIENVEEGIRMAGKSGIHVWDNHLLLHGLAAAIGKGDDTLFRQFQQRLNTEGGPKVDMYYYRFLLAWDAHLKGNMHLALDNMKMASNANIDVGFEIFAPFLHIKFAEIYYRSGDEKEAKKHLSMAYEKSIGAKSALFQYMCLLLDSHMKFNEGNDKEGLVLLYNALKAGREHHFESLCWWKTPFMTQLCLKALEEGIEVEYVREVIKKRNLMPPLSPSLSKSRGLSPVWKTGPGL